MSAEVSTLIDYLMETHKDYVFFVRRSDFGIIKANQSANIFLGTDKATVISRNVFDVLPFAVGEDLKESLKSGAAVNVNITQEADIYNLRAEITEGEILLAVAKLTQKTDSVEERNFRLLFENMSSGLVYLKVNFDENSNITGNEIVDTNSMFEMLFLIDRGKILGKSLNEVLPEIGSGIFQAINLTAKTGRSRSCSVEYKPTGKFLQVCTYSPRQRHTAVIFNDLKAEIDIRNNLKIKNKISKAFALGHDTDLYKVVLDLVLESTKSLYGYIGYISRRGDIISLARRDEYLPVTVDEDGYERLEYNSKYISYKAIESGQQETADTIIGHNRVLMTPVSDSDGKIIGVIGVFDAPRGYDVKAKAGVLELANYIAPMMLSEIKDRNYKRDLIEAKEKAEASVKLKNAILGNISHEIRTASNILESAISLLKRCYTPENSRDKSYFDMVLNASQSIVDLVDAIKNMSKIQTNQVVVSKNKTELNPLLETVRRKFEPEAQKKQLYFSIEKGLSDDDAVINADKAKITAVLKSLASNALKYTYTGGITVSYRLENGDLIFSVNDTGIGIRKELHNIIFEPFRQVDGEPFKRTYGGVGLGLSISKGFVDVMGGKIWLESETGKGSTFYFTIKYEKFGG